MSPRKLLVTGGAGFIGSHVCELALEQGWPVAVLDDLSTGHRANVPAGAAFHEGDIRDVAALDRVFTEFQPTAVSHQAAQASVAVSVREPARDADINVVGSLRVLEACVRHGCERFVFASTGGAIYGEVAEGTRAKVGDPLRPESPYAISKLAVEHYLRSFSAERGLRCTALRYANVYGPRQDPHGEAGVVAIFCQRLLAGEPVQVNAMREPGDGGCVRDYVHVSDVARVNLLALAGEIEAAIVDVGTGRGISTAQLLQAIQGQLDTDVEAGQSQLRPGDLMRSVLDPSALQALIGAPVALETGLATTARFFAGRAGVG